LDSLTQLHVQVYLFIWSEQACYVDRIANTKKQISKQTNSFKLSFCGLL